VKGDPAKIGPAVLLPLVYDALRAIARRYLEREGAYHTLQPTALVHEAYVRLAGREGIDWQGKTHFLAIAASEMRRVLVDHARAAGAKKRGAEAQRVPLDDERNAGRAATLELLALDEALTRLSAASPRQARVAEMRIFAGMRAAEIGQVLSISERTVKGDWRMARAWLARALRAGVGT
jgi:RNA polymerase sigma factor (TIGR02999 family)